MQYILKFPNKINGSIKLPASKSISNRALIINAVSLTPLSIKNLSDCDDTKVMLNAFKFENNTIDVKAAGTAMRFLTAFFSRLPGEWIITGSKRMKERPIHILVNALKTLGARIDYTENEGFPPLAVKGSILTGGELELSGAVSSQFISALMMIAPSMKKGLTLNLTGNIISIPYIKLTIQMMAEFGVEVSWKDNQIIIPHAEYVPINYLVESDWSGASYWYEMLALSQAGEIELLGLFENSMQGDAKVADLFTDLGIHTEFTEKGVRLRKQPIKIKKMFQDFSDIPDLAQTFAVTCCILGIPFLFTGLQTLKIKETDRIEALKVELRKLGFVLTDRENSILEWDGQTCEPEQDPIIKTYEDHRMAMAFSPAATKIVNLKIDAPFVVSKSYPNYWKDLESVGVKIAES